MCNIWCPLSLLGDWVSIKEWQQHLKSYKQLHGPEPLHDLLSMIYRGEWDPRLVLPTAPLNPLLSQRAMDSSREGLAQGVRKRRGYGSLPIARGTIIPPTFPVKVCHEGRMKDLEVGT